MKPEHQWVDLTDEEIMDIRALKDGRPYGTFELCKAISAALKAKNAQPERKQVIAELAGVDVEPALAVYRTYDAEHDKVNYQILWPDETQTSDNDPMQLYTAEALAAVRLQEREACAEICERIWPSEKRSGHEWWLDGFVDGTCDCADAIRNQGVK